jgi:hypothetical protein
MIGSSILALVLLAQTTAIPDTVVLHDGEVIVGTLLLTAPGEPLSIRTRGGDVRAIPLDQVRRVNRGGVVPPPALPSSPTKVPAGRSYLYQTVVIDGISDLLLIIALQNRLGPPRDAAVPGIAGSAGALLGAPIVHWAHGKGGRGFRSLGMRLGMGLLGFLVGGAIVQAIDRNCFAASALPAPGYGFAYCGEIGAVGGAVAATIMESTLFEHD